MEVAGVPCHRKGTETIDSELQALKRLPAGPDVSCEARTPLAMTIPEEKPEGHPSPPALTCLISIVSWN